MRAQPKASHFVDGAYLEDTDGQVIEVTYPATGEVIARLHGATPRVIEAAIAAAARAQPLWAAETPAARGRVLRRAAAIMRERNRDLSIIETLDTGKPLQETLVADAASGADCLEYFGGIIAGDTGSFIPLGRDFVYTRREALGICAGIGAWNYPIQIASWKAGPALACGNAMIFKPSETTPLSALKLAEILIEAGAPPGLFNVVQGRGEVGGALTGDPRIAKVSLTGSVPTGRRVYAAAAAQMKHVTMELGGKSPLVIFEDADLENAVSAAINANFYSSGQVCSNGTRVFVQAALHDAFVDRLLARLDGVVVGDPLDETVNYGPLVSERQREIVLGFIEAAQAEGARLVAGGRRIDREGFWVEPTVFAGVTDDMTIARDEIFGPVMSVLSFDTEDEVLRRANATEYGLSAGVFTRDIQRAHRVVAALQAGTCWINTYNLTPVEAPFGGIKASGLGRENSAQALTHYSQIKSVYVAGGDVAAPY